MTMSNRTFDILKYIARQHLAPLCLQFVAYGNYRTASKLLARSQPLTPFYRHCWEYLHTTITRMYRHERY